VTIDGDITVNNITIGQGTSGILLIGNNGTARTLNVIGNITVNAGAQFAVNSGSATSGHMLNLSGNILNNGTFDLGPSATSRCQTTFNKDDNQTISGAGATTRFYLMTLNMGTTNINVLDITASNFLTQSTGFLTITNGTFKYEAPSAITPFIATTTIPLTGGFWVNNSSAVVTTIGGNLSVRGFVRVTNGVLNIGTAADQQLLSNGGTFIIEGGAVNISGSFTSAPYAIMNFTISGGTFTVPTVGSTTSGQAPFMLSIAGSTFNQTGGAIVIRNAGNGNLGYINTNTSSSSVLGGALQIGDYGTLASQIMQINSTTPVYNLIDSSANATAQLMTNNLTVNNNVLIAAGTLNTNNLDMNVKGNWTNKGTFIPGTSTVTFSGSTGSIITKATGETFNNLTINKSSNDVSLGGAATVNGAFNFASAHNLLLGNYNLTLGSVATISGTPAAGQCIVTNGSGVVSRSITASNFTFPIGSDATHYNPVKITNNGAVQMYTASVAAGTTPLGTAKAINTCGRTWTITGGGTADIAFSWNTSDAGSVLQGFPSSSSAWRYVTSDWVEQGGVTVTGTPNVTTVTGVTSFSSWIVGTSGGLPVEMTSFTAAAQSMSAQLKWNTATEVNNYGFEIERRAITSSAWAKVGFVAGNGTSNTAHNYTYADNNLIAGTYAYRLKQIDNDGAFKYSASTEVAIAGVPKELKLFSNYPNPFNPSTKVQFTVPENGNVRLLVYNVIGQEVATLFNGAVEAGNLYTANFDGSHMASGLYFSVLEFGNQRITHKMMMTK
jgi:hypothetical protein